MELKMELEAAPQLAHVMEQDPQLSHSLHWQSTGHLAASWQPSASVVPPSQYFPPCSGFGLSHFLSRCFVPKHFPGCRIQSDHAPHSPQPPSIGQGAVSKPLQGLFITSSDAEQGRPPQEGGVQLLVRLCSPGSPPFGEHFCSRFGLALLMQASQPFQPLNSPCFGQQTLLQASVSVASDLASSAQVFPLFNSLVQPLVLVFVPSRQVLEHSVHGCQGCHSASLDTTAVTLLSLL